MGEHSAETKCKDPIFFSRYLYRARNLIERFFNKIKQCRRVATRYDKLAASYLVSGVQKYKPVALPVKVEDGPLADLIGVEEM